MSERRTRLDFARFVAHLADARCPGAERIVLVMDQLNTPTPASLHAAFPAAEAQRLADRLEVHHTPKHGSWLNVAEIELATLERPCLRQRFGDRTSPRGASSAWAARRNAAKFGVAW